MENIFQEFGINWYLVLAQAINFLVILYLLKRYVYKPVFNILKKREEMVKKGIDDAKIAKETLEKAEEERRKIIKDARDDAKLILDEANTSSREIIHTAQDKAKKQTLVTLHDAKEEIEREARITEKKIQGNIGAFIEKILHESLREYLSSSDQNIIIEKIIQRLQRNV